MMKIKNSYLKKKYNKDKRKWIHKQEKQLQYKMKETGSYNL